MRRDATELLTGSAFLADEKRGHGHDNANGYQACHDPQENDAVFLGLTFGTVDALRSAEAMNVARLRYEGILHVRAFMTASPTGKLIGHLGKGGGPGLTPGKEDRARTICGRLQFVWDASRIVPFSDKRFFK